MMEKPGRWLLISIGLVVLSLLLVYKKEISLGADLKGGTRLVYRVPVGEAKSDGSLESGADTKDTVQKTIDVMNKRVDVLGLREISIVGQGEDEIIVELPGLTEQEIVNIKNTITSLGKLEFKILANDSDFDLEREKKKLEDFFDKAENKAKIEQWQKDEALKAADSNRNLNFWVDLVKEFNANKGDGGPVKGLRWYVSRESELSIRGRDQKSNAAFDWTADNRKTRPYFLPMRLEDQLDAKEGPKLLFTGADLTNVHIAADPRGGRGIGFSIVPGRRSEFGEFTGRNVGRALSIILNEQVDSTPSIKGELTDDIIIESQQAGGYTIDEAKALLTILETGSLKVKPILDSEARLGASLGEDSIKLGILSSVLALVATIGFMVLYYRVAGIIAAVSLAVNGAVLLGVLSLYSATLTLPGIGGFILTLAMAVDSNILIYERIREERDRGRGIEQAVKLGFERAFVTIVDSNLTTLLTSVVLYWIGTGPIKGLGLTLSVGILTTLFAALIFTKATFGWLLSKKALPEVKMLRLFKQTPNLQFIKIWKLTVAISVLTSIAGLAAFFASPESVFGIDFVGGATARVKLTQPMTLNEFRAIVNKTPGFEDHVDANQSLSKGSAEGNGYKEFVVKGKLTRTERDKIKKDETGAAQEQVNSFRKGLRQVLGDRLRPDPVTDLTITPAAKATDLSDTKFTLRFADPVAAKLVQDELARASFLTSPAVGETAQPSNQFTVTAKIASTITADDLLQRIPVAFAAVAKTGAGRLSDPFPEIATIQPRAAKSLKNKAILALLISFAGIILYVRFRFHEYRYGIGGVVGIVHDLVVTLGVVAIANMTGLVDVEIDMTLIAVFLTIAGYSINDTIVIFDRIRENLGESETDRKPLGVVVDESCNQTLSRTLLTSTAAFLSSALMFFINRGQHNPLEGFGFTMMVGIASGTYSSIWVASLFIVGVEHWVQRGKKANSKNSGGTQKSLATTSA